MEYNSSRLNCFYYFLIILVSKYNYILQCWTYDYKIDYNVFKLARK